MRIRIAAACAAALLTLSSAGAQQPATTSPPVLTASQWRDDLKFIAAELQKRHANLYHHVSRGDFERAVAALDRQIPNLPRNRIIVGMMRIAAMVGDGHTRVEPRKDPAFGFASLPVKLYLFDDGLFIRAARPEQRGLLGARVEAIGGVPAIEAIRRVSELASRDNAMGPKLYAPLYLAMPDILEAVGLSNSRDTANLTDFHFHDRVSSVRVISGAWLLCEDDYGRGHCITVTHDEPKMGRLGMDDAVTSVMLDDRGRGRDRDYRRRDRGRDRDRDWNQR